MTESSYSPQPRNSVLNARSALEALSEDEQRKLLLQALKELDAEAAAAETLVCLENLFVNRLSWGPCLGTNVCSANDLARWKTNCPADYRRLVVDLSRRTEDTLFARLNAINVERVAALAGRIALFTLASEPLFQLETTAPEFSSLNSLPYPLTRDSLQGLQIDGDAPTDVEKERMTSEALLVLYPEYFRERRRQQARETLAFWVSLFRTKVRFTCRQLSLLQWPSAPAGVWSHEKIVDRWASQMGGFSDQMILTLNHTFVWIDGVQLLRDTWLTRFPWMKDLPAVLNEEVFAKFCATWNSGACPLLPTADDLHNLDPERLIALYPSVAPPPAHTEPPLAPPSNVPEVVLSAPYATEEAFARALAARTDSRARFEHFALCYARLTHS